MKLSPALQAQLRDLVFVVLVGAACLTVSTANAQQAFATPEAAAEALVDGLARHDPAQVESVLGTDFRRYIPLDDTSAEDRTDFPAAWARGHRIMPEGSNRAMLEVGTHGWTLPIPLVRASAGWRFDTRAGAEEMRIRRIGRNELAVIQSVLAYVDAQHEYQARDWDGDGVRSYAARLLSTPGKRDGLYWAALSGEPQSPLGPAYADASAGDSYHGYHYRILRAQGPAASGGAKRYVRDGRMTEGFGLVAWPARYGDTGVMTFIVNQDGVVHEKDLGPGTAGIARKLDAYNPDPGWRRIATTAP
jgi:hypothetical protein